MKNFDAEVKLAIFRWFAETGRRPELPEVAGCIGSSEEVVTEAYLRLQADRVLSLEKDGVSIRMAPPFSGVVTEHVVEVGPLRYFANCAWDALGIPAALHRPATIRSRCGQSGESLRLEVGTEGPETSDWLFHSLVPAAHWWDDIVFT